MEREMMARLIHYQLFASVIDYSTQLKVRATAFFQK